MLACVEGPRVSSIAMISGIGFSGSWKLGPNPNLARAHVKTNGKARVGIDIGTTGCPAKRDRAGTTGKHHTGRESLGRYSFPVLYLSPTQPGLNCTKKAFDPKPKSPGGREDPSLNIPQAQRHPPHEL